MASSVLRPGVLLLVTLLCCSCGARKMYSGPERPRDDVAVIEGSRDVGGLRIYFSGTAGDGSEFDAPRIEIRPGRRELRVYFATESSDFIGGYLSIAFEARGGRTYRVRGTEYERSVWIWIEDTWTHEIVGGRRPP